MRLYNRYITYVLLFGWIGMHIMCIAVDIFFIYRFIIIDYDPNVYFLLAFFTLSPIILDALSYFGKVYVLKRVLIRYKTDETGIHFYGLCIKSWTLPWDSINIYAIAGYNTPGKLPMIFLANDFSSLFDIRNLGVLDKNHMHFPIRDETWSALSPHMPEDMKKKLKYSMDKQEECFHRRRVSGNNS